MALQIPYADLLGPKDPLVALASTPRRIARLVKGWRASRWSSTYAPGKWTAAQIVLHLALDEIAWPDRLRYLVTVPGFRMQPFDGADWVTLESPPDPHVALSAYLALRRLNLTLYDRAWSQHRTKRVSHPEFGRISVEWVLRVLAGHDLHHLSHLQIVARA